MEEKYYLTKDDLNPQIEWYCKKCTTVNYESDIDEEYQCFMCGAVHIIKGYNA